VKQIKDVKVSDYFIRDDCRLCKSKNLSRVLELPSTPLANEFVTSSHCGIFQEKFPLFLSQCRQCGHVQLPVVVDPERLFRNYVYVSGTSKAFIAHFEALATEVIARNGIPRGALVVEIGSNDGTALKAFKERGMNVLGVDPATNIAAAASNDGIPTLPHFFTVPIAEEILDREGHAKLVIANNVFAHADDLEGILEGVITLLEPASGVFVFEVQYLGDMMEHGYFDMIYHEHLSYHALAPLVPFLGRKGLQVLSCQYVSTHGGSIRVTCGLRKPTSSESEQLQLMIEAEGEKLNRYGFRRMAETIEKASTDLINLLRATNRKVWGFGGPAKLTTLFYALNLNSNSFVAIIDDSPLKQGLFTPGAHIPVVSFDDFQRRATNTEEVLVIFAWNFTDQIKQRFIGTSHKLFTPLPTLKMVNQFE